MVNHWPIQNNTLDIKGNAHLYNGVNVPFTTDRNEKSAIRLTYGYYQVPAGVYFSGDFTISVWIRLNKLVNWARIIDFGNGAPSNNIILASSNVASGQPILILYNNTSTNTRVATGSSLKIGNWTHIAFTLNGSIGKIYMNGTFAALTPFLRPINISRSLNYVGKSNWATNENLNADLDDLMIFNRSLSESEINELMGLSITTTTTTTTSSTTSTTSTSTSSTSTSSTSTLIISTTTSSSTVATSTSPSTSLSTTISSTTSTIAILISTSTSSTTTTFNAASSTFSTTSTSSTELSTTQSVTSTTFNFPTTTINVITTSATSYSSSTTASLSFSSLTSSIATSSSSISMGNLILNLNSTFNFSQLSNFQTINLLNSNYDLSGCIVNCSNRGLCKFDLVNNNFICSCNSIYLSGYACQIDTRPCSSNPCLNNATCVDYSNSGYYNMSRIINANSSSFYCLCDQYYKGTYCESKIDVCLNETCSSNGNCFDLNNKAKCKCFSMYSGDKCESESNELKTVKTIISLASILAIIILVLFYSCFVLMDITKFGCKNINIIKQRHNVYPLIQKYIYISK